LPPDTSRRLSETALFPNSSIFAKFYLWNSNYMPVLNFSECHDLRKIAVLGQALRGLFGKINLGDGKING